MRSAHKEEIRRGHPTLLQEELVLGGGGLGGVSKSCRAMGVRLERAIVLAHFGVVDEVIF